MKLLDIINSPWAIQREKLHEIREIYTTHLRGDKIDIKSVEARLGTQLKNPPQDMDIRDGVAVIPVTGVLGPKMNLLMHISGGSSMQMIGDQVTHAALDDAVKAIILDIDSPGGTVAGTEELANLVFEAGQQKQIVAFVRDEMLSAAQWIGAAAHRTIISGQTATVGSIGVVATHVDISQAEKMRGMKTTEITSGEFKRIASEHAPLSKEGRESIQETVDFLFSIFVGEVARFRGELVDSIQEKVGSAKVFIGRQGIEVGLVDGIMTFDTLLQELSGSGGGREEDDILQTSIKGELAMSKESEGKKELPKITADYLAMEYPDVHNEVKMEGFEKGKKSGWDEAYRSGAENERKRIKAVEEQILPGHEALVSELKFDGKTSGEQAAVKILQAEKGKAEARMAQLGNDSPPIVESSETPAGKKDFSHLPPKERAEKEWEADPKIREEFLSRESYAAYLRTQTSHK